MLGEGVIVVEEELVISELGGATTFELLLGAPTPAAALGALGKAEAGLPMGLVDVGLGRAVGAHLLPLPLPPGDTPTSAPGALDKTEDDEGTLTAGNTPNPPPPLPPPPPPPPPPNINSGGPKGPGTPKGEFMKAFLA